MLAEDGAHFFKWVPKLKESSIAEEGKCNRMKVSKATKTLSETNGGEEELLCTWRARTEGGE